MQQEATFSALRDRFLRWIAAGRLHALILAAPERAAREHTLRLMAGALLCTGDDPEARPCGACKGCAMFSSGNHPDDLILPAEQKGVDDIRNLTVALSRRRWVGGFRTIRIPWADALTPQAQNALLKTLEEPPEGSVFLLGADHAERLLPTIRSRCVIWSGGGHLAFSDEDQDAALRLLSPDPSVRWAAVEEVRAEGALDALEDILLAAARAHALGTSPPSGTERFTIAALLVMIKATSEARRMVKGHVSWPMALTGLITTFGEIL